MKKLVIGTVIAVSAVVLSPVAALATPTLPASQTWVDAPLQEMVRVSGRIALSISGSGFRTQTGTIDVEKPDNGTVIAAYMTSAVSWDIPAPPDVQIAGQPVTFTHHAKKTTGTPVFYNHFADVTDLVKSTIDSHAAGTVTLALDEGTAFADSSLNDGEELVVIFDDPAKTTSSAIIMFGASAPSGDSFTVNFPALTDLNSQKATFSLGISYSNQRTNRVQHSDVNLSTSSNPSPQPVSVTAGGYDDGNYTNVSFGDGALITVGGIGDSDALPELTPTSDDDELYGLSSFLRAGDTSITVHTQNATGDDNIFESVFYFEGVEIAGAVDVTGGSSSPDPSTGSEATLPETGSENPVFFALPGGIAAVLMVLGALLVATRKHSKAKHRV